MRSLAIISLLSLFCISVCLAAPANDLSRDEWMGEYYGGHKIGFAHTTVKKDKFEGKSVYRLDQVVQTKHIYLGMYSRSSTEYTLYVDDSNFAPLYEARKISTTFDPKQPLKVTRSVEVRYKDNSVECTTISDGETTRRSLPTLPGADLAASSKYRLRILKPVDEEQASFDFFDIGRLEFEKATISYLGKQKVAVGGKEYTATATVEKLGAMPETKRWQLDSGEVIKTENSLGGASYRETREEAIKDIEVDSTTSDKPKDQPKEDTSVDVKDQG